MVQLHKFIFNPFSENTYIIFDDTSKEAAIIDPGCSNEREESILQDFVESQKLSIKYMLNTHCHVDHIIGNAFVKKKYNPQFLAPKGDAFLLNEQANSPSFFGIVTEISPQPDSFITGELKIRLGEYEISFLSTPGHTPDEYCIYLPTEDICITGDVLFLEGIGRTDLWGGNYEQLLSSIKNKLFTFPEHTVCYPGHGDKTTIGYEKIHNPFL